MPFTEKSNHKRSTTLFLINISSRLPGGKRENRWDRRAKSQSRNNFSRKPLFEQYRFLFPPLTEEARVKNLERSSHSPQVVHYHFLRQHRSGHDSTCEKFDFLLTTLLLTSPPRAIPRFYPDTLCPCFLIHGGPVANLRYYYVYVFYLSDFHLAPLRIFGSDASPTAARVEAPPIRNECNTNGFRPDVSSISRSARRAW